MKLTHNMENPVALPPSLPSNKVDVNLSPREAGAGPTQYQGGIEIVHLRLSCNSTECEGEARELEQFIEHRDGRYILTQLCKACRDHKALPQTPQPPDVLSIIRGGKETAYRCTLSLPQQVGQLGNTTAIDLTTTRQVHKFCARTKRFHPIKRFCKEGERKIRQTHLQGQQQDQQQEQNQQAEQGLSQPQQGLGALPAQHALEAAAAATASAADTKCQAPIAHYGATGDQQGTNQPGGAVAATGDCCAKYIWLGLDAVRALNLNTTCTTWRRFLPCADATELAGFVIGCKPLSDKGFLYWAK